MTKKESNVRPEEATKPSAPVSPPRINLSLSIESFVRELLNNPPGLNGVPYSGVSKAGRIGNAHVDQGWIAALTKVLEFIEGRYPLVVGQEPTNLKWPGSETGRTQQEWQKGPAIVDEASEVTEETWDAVGEIAQSSSGIVSVISTEKGPNWAAEVSVGYDAHLENGTLTVGEHPVSVEILEETFNPPHTSPFTTKGKLVGPSLFSMICLQDFKEGSSTPKKTWIACERPREVIHYDGVDYKYAGVQDGRMFYVREGK